MSLERPVFPIEPLRKVSIEASPTQKPSFEKDGQGYFWDNVVSFPESFRTENEQIQIFPKLTGKALLTTFFVSEILDMIITEADLNVLKTGTEVSPFGMGALSASYTLENLIELKLALSAVAIIAYGLTSIHDRKVKLPLPILGTVRFMKATEFSLQVVTAFQVGVLAWDSANFIPDLVSKLKL